MGCTKDCFIDNFLAYAVKLSMEDAKTKKSPFANFGFAKGPFGFEGINREVSNKTIKKQAVIDYC